MGEATDSRAESAAWFVVIANGTDPKASVVAGLDGVREALIPLVLAGLGSGRERTRRRSVDSDR